MGNLASYSVESDQSILLNFNDGTQKRVGSHQLGQYLNRVDVARVKRGLVRRQQFKGALPKWVAIMALTAGLVAMLAGKQAARRINVNQQDNQSFSKPASQLTPTTDGSSSASQGFSIIEPGERPPGITEHAAQPAQEHNQAWVNRNLKSQGSANKQEHAG